MRCSSFLDYDLYKSNIILNSTCRCGAICEDTKHFFLKCPPYEAARVINLNQTVDVEGNDIDLLTRGKSDLLLEDNDLVFKHLLNFIWRSDRLLIVLFSWFRRRTHTHTTCNLYGYLPFSCIPFVFFTKILHYNCNLFFCIVHAHIKCLVKIVSEWVIVVQRQLSNFSAISWREQIKILNWRRLHQFV